MSILDSKDGVYTEAPSPYDSDEDIEIWSKLSMSIAKRTVLAKCVDFEVNTCVTCIDRHGLSNVCPVCGSNNANANERMASVFTCQCGALLAMCHSTDGRNMVCGVSVPIVMETEDSI